MATTNKMTKAQAYYLETFFVDKTPKDLAKDTGLTVSVVKAYVTKLNEAGVSPPHAAPARSTIEKAGYASRNGVVSMTQSASEKADAFKEEDRKGRRGPGIHIINPNLPVN